MAHHTSLLSRQRDVIASFSFGAWRVWTCFQRRRFLISTTNFTFYFLLPSNSSELSTIMSSPGQKRGTCSHVMASFDGHFKCARCRDKGVGEDACVLKKDCLICKGFTPEQILQLATPTYRERKSKEKKLVSSSPAPTFVDPSHLSVLGKVEGDKVAQPETTPAAKKTKHSESTKPSAKKKKSSSGSRPSADDLKKLDEKWSERFWLEAMLVAKTFTVPVEPVVKPVAEVTNNQKPFFDPSASTSSLARETFGPSLVQATGEAVEEMQMATQPLEAPCPGTATQPVQVPGSVPDVQPSGEGDIGAASDSEGDQHSVTGSLSDENYRYGSLEVLWVGTTSQSSKLCPLLMTTPLPVHVFSQPVKFQSSTRGYAGRWENLTSPSQRGTLQGTLTLLASSKISLSSHPDLPDGMGCILRRRTVRVTQYAPGHRNRLN